MKRGKKYVVPHRRKREGRTDYRKRLKFLKSGKPRFVVRKSKNNITCQIVEYNPTSDRVLVSVNTKNIQKLGWKGHCGNIPSSYLTGLLCGTLAKNNNINMAILDMGLHSSTKGSRLYSALKGALDAGLNIPHSPEALPGDDRISGKHISNSPTKPKIDIEKNFQEIKTKILGKQKTTKTKPKKG